jgi:regulator of cell morphogenesis and NO signaling
MTALPTTTVGEIASRHPETIRVFQRLGIEFCCDGRLTLAEICRERNLAFDALERALAAAVAAPAPRRQDWNARPLADLTHHLTEAFHEPLDHELPRLRPLAVRVAGHCHAATRGQGVVLEELDRLLAGLQRHLATTDHALFPLICHAEARGASESGRQAFDHLRDALEADHRDARRALEVLRSATDRYNPPSDACATWRALYRGLNELEQLMQLHVHLENNVLIPRAAALFAADRT